MSYPTKILTFNRKGPNRRGLSIVEVLTSIVVAMIGVFGVMVLIPFAVKQAQTGLDSDAAVTVARNSYSQFEVAGHRSPNSWAFTRVTPTTSGIDGYTPFSAADWNFDGNLIPPQDDRNGDGELNDGDSDYPQAFSIDPLALMELAADRTGALSPVPNPVDFARARFPFHHVNIVGTFPTSTPNGVAPAAPFAVDDLVIPAATLIDAEGNLLTREMARRMFRSANDLVFGEQTADFGGPVQAVDMASGIRQRRQSLGRISWSAIVVPFKNQSGSTGIETSRWSYRMYILVYKDRKILTPLNPAQDAEGAMAVAQLDTLLDGSETLSQINSGVKSPLGNVYLENGPAGSPVKFTGSGAMKRDDWVLLINRGRNTNPTNHPIYPGDGGPPPGVTYAEKGFDKQLAFCRVVNFADEPDSQVAPASVTLDGPDFNFGDATLGFGDPDRVILQTYMIHLRDVVTVYERTFSPETESNWN